MEVEFNDIVRVVNKGYSRYGQIGRVYEVPNPRIIKVRFNTKYQDRDNIMVKKEWVIKATIKEKQVFRLHEKYE